MKIALAQAQHPTNRVVFLPRTRRSDDDDGLTLKHESRLPASDSGPGSNIFVSLIFVHEAGKRLIIRARFELPVDTVPP